MLVYGGGRRDEATLAILLRIEAALAGADRLSGHDRHEALVTALIEAGALAQGLADQGFETRGGTDDLDPAADAALALARRIAECVVRSWDAGFAEATGCHAHVGSALTALRAADLPGRVSVREPEGFAHYAVYPEAFAAAARDLPDEPLCVVGIRSIGTTLAAVVAARCRTVSALLTLRPVGHPFRRELAVSPALRAVLAARAAGRFVVVDEGPGLSGSSIASAVQFLLALGADPDRIAIVSSHAGLPGPEASPAVRAIWDRTARHVRRFDDVALGAALPAHRLETWAGDLVGPVRGPAREISGGEWRRLTGASEADWPPAHPWQERRKFLLETETGTWLCKFAGLGRAGAEKLALARRLAEAGFVPEPAGLRHGFRVERWHSEGRPLDLRLDRAPLLARLGAYLAVRAGLAVPAGLAGATIRDLFAMLRQNAGEGIGPEAARAAERWTPCLDRFEAGRRPALTDNRLQAWEWFVAADRILKADAVDHHAGHDLVGPQDIAWDVAGASVEFGLDRPERDRLLAHLAMATGRATDPEFLRFSEAAYSAFWLGYYAMAAGGAAPGERERLGTAAERYRDRLAASLL